MSIMDSSTITPVQVVAANPLGHKESCTVAVLVSARALRECSRTGRIDSSLGGENLRSKLNSLLESIVADPRIEFRIDTSGVRVVLVTDSGTLELQRLHEVQIVREPGYTHLRAGERNRGQWTLDSTLRTDGSGPARNAALSEGRAMYVRTCIPALLGLGGGRYETIF